MKFHWVLLLFVSLVFSNCRKKPAAAPESPAPTPGGAASGASPMKDPDLTALNAAYKKFWQEQKSPPAKLEDLVAKKYLPSIPTPPPGKKFNVDWSRMEVTLVNE